eukprot:Nk52_evm44s208 gene=Nk52_evmTU44s208
MKGKTVDLAQLISAGIDLTHKAGLLIRRVATGGEDLGIVDKAEDEVEESARKRRKSSRQEEKKKKVEDPQTIADRRAQLLITGSLRREFGPQLCVIGEEGDLGEDQSEVVKDVQLTYLKQGDTNPLLGETEMDLDPLPENLSQLRMEEVTVWVDPLDATREFTEGQYDHVTVLLGIAYAGAPVAGIMYQPFFTPTAGRCVWGCVGLGAFQWQFKDKKEEGSSSSSVQSNGCDDGVVVKSAKQIIFNDSNPNVMSYMSVSALTSEEYKEKISQQHDELRIVTSQSRGMNSAVAMNAIESLEPLKVIKYGGCGRKVLALLDEEADMYLYPCPGTKKWDTCAPHAILLAVGGILTDQFGVEYTYEKSVEHQNNDGLIASAQEYCHQTLVDACAVVPATEDITRLVNSKPITVQWLSQIFEKQGFPKGSVGYFSAPEQSAIRGKHSQCAQLILKHSREAKKSKSVGANEIPSSVFLKRIVVADLEDRTDEKWIRDIGSYEVEASFYLHFAKNLKGQGITVPRPFFVHCERNEVNFRDSKFLMVLEDLVDCEQFPLLNVSQAQSALQFLARFHGHFWCNEHRLKHANEYLWSQGGYWSIEKRGTGELRGMVEVWKQFVENWKGEYDLFKKDDIVKLGERLYSRAEFLDNHVIVDSSSSHRTVVHGDFKTANIFFPRKSSRRGSGKPKGGSNDEHAATDIVPIDFQWCGVGLSTMDVAYFICSSLSMECLEREEDLLKFYYDHLKAQESVVKDGYSFETFITDYKYTVLDYARMVVAYHWKNFASPDAIRAQESKLGRCSHNRSVSHVLWLVKKVDTLLKELEAQGH